MALECDLELVLVGELGGVVQNVDVQESDGRHDCKLCIGREKKR